MSLTPILLIFLAVLLVVIGVVLLLTKKDKNAAKVLFILSGISLVVGVGLCTA